MPRTMNVPRRNEGIATLAAAPAPAPAPAPHPNNGPSGAAGETPIKQEEEEETLGQLRDRLGPGLARVPAPGPRAAFVHIKVEDTTSGEDPDGEKGGADGEEGVEATGGEGDHGEGEKEEDEEDEDEKEDEKEDEELGQPREQH